jgi:hypothetical protein
MQMHRQWMYNADRRSKEFIDGLHHFLDVVEANKRNGFMCCPYRYCKNKKDYSSSRILYNHIFSHGFMPNYIHWTSHREKWVIMEENEEEECEDNFPAHAGFGAFDYDTAMKEALEGEAPDDDPTDDLG